MTVRVRSSETAQIILLRDSESGEKVKEKSSPEDGYLRVEARRRMFGRKNQLRSRDPMSRRVSPIFDRGNPYDEKSQLLFHERTTLGSFILLYLFSYLEIR